MAASEARAIFDAVRAYRRILTHTYPDVADSDPETADDTRSAISGEIDGPRVPPSLEGSDVRIVHD